MAWTAQRADWLTVCVLLVLFFAYFEHLQPFYRQFRLDDVSLQHPFAVVERVTDIQLYLVLTLVPMLYMAAVAVHRAQTRRAGDAAPKPVSVAVLGLWMSLVLAAILTDVLKVWIGNPRPDFLERCGAAAGTPSDSFVAVDVCTAPLGASRLADGMKSTPLGHSSIAFAGMYFLFLWMGRDAGVRKSWLLLLARTLPMLAAAYIALSRTQDYRHHFKDVFLGLLLGAGTARLVYEKYFHE